MKRALTLRGRQFVDPQRQRYLEGGLNVAGPVRTDAVKRDSAQKTVLTTVILPPPRPGTARKNPDTPAKSSTQVSKPTPQIPTPHSFPGQETSGWIRGCFSLPGNEDVETEETKFPLVVFLPSTRFFPTIICTLLSTLVFQT